MAKTIIEIFRCTERSAVDGVEETRGRRKKENEDNIIIIKYYDDDDE